MKTYNIQTTLFYDEETATLDNMNKCILQIKDIIDKVSSAKLIDFIKIIRFNQRGMKFIVTYIFPIEASTSEEAVKTFREITHFNSIDCIREKILVGEEE